MEALLLPVLLIAVFYFLLIRPQQKQRRQMADLQQSVQPGTKVMTTAGLVATVVEVDDDNDQVVLEVAPGVHSRYVRRSIAQVIQPEEPSVADVSPAGTETAADAVDDLDAPKHEPAQAQREDRTNGDDLR